MGDGRRQYLCKRYPTVLDLALRGFAPAWLQRRLQTRLDRYELHEQAGDAVLWDPPIASGCFMLCRRAALEQVGGFRPDYFLYFEDFDLSLRLAAVTRLAYAPQVRIVHLGGHAARKGSAISVCFCERRRGSSIGMDGAGGSRGFFQNGPCW